MHYVVRTSGVRGVSNSLDGMTLLSLAPNDQVTPLVNICKPAYMLLIGDDFLASILFYTHVARVHKNGQLE